MLRAFATLFSSALAAALLLACGSSTTTAGVGGAGGAYMPPGSGGDSGPAEPICEEPEGMCNIVACELPRKSASHHEPCTDLSWDTNPPTSGPHYGIWAAYKVYTEPVPRGFYVHSLEHSGVVLAYNCDRYDGDCPALADELAQFRQDYGRDELCEEAVHNRIIVTPDPMLDVPFAAMAWGYSLTGDCFDEQLVQSFTDAHYGMNYENFCSDGVDATDPASGFPNDCGQ